MRGAKAKAPVGGAAGGSKGAKAMVKPVLTVETNAKKVNDYIPYPVSLLRICIRFNAEPDPAF